MASVYINVVCFTLHLYTFRLPNAPWSISDFNAAIFHPQLLTTGFKMIKKGGWFEGIFQDSAIKSLEEIWKAPIWDESSYSEKCN